MNMETNKEIRILFWIAGLFALAFYLPIESATFVAAIYAALDLAKWYAREHVVLCLLPAFFIAGSIAIFVSQGSVLRYFGAKAKKWVAYTVASVSGTILAVCSCTILPLFSSIHKRGAGLGPAIAFLYSGPAINILAIILTARILGWEMGLARTVGAVAFSVVIGLAMSAIYRKEEGQKRKAQMAIPDEPEKRPIGQTAAHLGLLVLILVFANWGSPGQGDTSSFWYYLWALKWPLVGLLALLLGVSLVKVLGLGWRPVALAGLATAAASALSFGLVGDPRLAPLPPMLVAIGALAAITLKDTNDPDNPAWTESAWGFAKQILPLLALGVLVAGFLLGSTHDGQSLPGIIPNAWIAGLVGGNSLASNFFASFVGAFMYFATLTEVPILQGLMAAGMGKGPALALLLAGPSLSLPNMLVIKGVLGTGKTAVYVGLVVVMATVSGWLFGLVA